MVFCVRGSRHNHSHNPQIIFRSASSNDWTLLCLPKPTGTLNLGYEDGSGYLQNITAGRKGWVSV